MASKYVERNSTSSVMGEMQIKIIVRYCHTPNRTTKMKEKKYHE